MTPYPNNTAKTIVGGTDLTWPPRPAPSVASRLLFFKHWGAHPHDNPNPCRLCPPPKTKQLRWEQRLQKEAKKELRRRIRRRRARAAGLNPAALPKLRLAAAEFARSRGVFFAVPTSFRVPPFLALTTRRLVGSLRAMGTGDGGPPRERGRFVTESPAPAIEG